MAYRDERYGRGERRPRRRSSPFAKLVVFVLVAGLGGAAYIGWRYRQRTGGLDYDKERLREVVSDEVDGAKVKIESARRAIKDASLKTVEGARDLLTSVEAWLKQRKVSPATREELKEIDERYAREPRPAAGAPSLPVPVPVETRGEEPEPVGPSVSTVSGAAKAEAAALVTRGRAEFTAGREHWRAAGEPGSPREQEELALARERFVSAQDLLTLAQEKTPDDPEIERLLVETNRFLYDCLKRLKVDVRSDA